MLGACHLARRTLVSIAPFPLVLATWFERGLPRLAKMPSLSLSLTERRTHFQPYFYASFETLLSQALRRSKYCPPIRSNQKRPSTSGKVALQNINDVAGASFVQAAASKAAASMAQRSPENPGLDFS